MTRARMSPNDSSDDKFERFGRDDAGGFGGLVGWFGGFGVVMGLGEVGRVDDSRTEEVEGFEVLSVRTSDLSSDYEPSDNSDEESEPDVDTDTPIGILSVIAVCDVIQLLGGTLPVIQLLGGTLRVLYQTSGDLPDFHKRHGPLLHIMGNSAYNIFSSLWTDEVMALFVEESNKYY